MYSENEKISLRQLKRLLVFDFFGIISLIVPYIIVNTAGFDGLLAIFIGGVFAVIYLLIIMFFIKNINESYLTFSKHCVGTILTFIISALYIIKYLFSIVLLTKIFSEVVNRTLLINYSRLLIIVPMIMVAGYIAYKGCEVRARVAEVLYFIVLIPIFFFLIMGVKNIDLANLTPIFSQRIDFTLKGAFSFFLLFNTLEMLLFLKPLVRVDKKNGLVEKSILSYSIQSVAIVIVIAMFFFALTVGLVGEEAAGASMWSSVFVFQFARIPGSFLNRQDSLLLAFWLLTIFSAVSGFLYYLCYILKDMYRIKSKNSLMPLVMIFVILLSAVPIDLEDYFATYMKYLTYLGVPQSIIIPLILIIISRLRGKHVMKHVKKAVMFVIILLFIPLFTGCTEKVQIEDRDFVQAIGVDYENNQIVVHYVLPNIGEVTQQNSGDGSGSNDMIRTFTGHNYYEIEEQYKLCSSKKLDFSHLKAIIFGKSLSENSEKFKEFVEYTENKYEVSKNTHIYLVNDRLETIIELNQKVPNGIGYYLEELYRNNLVNSEKEEITLGSLINEKNAADLSVHIPILTILNKALSIQGEGIIKDSTLRYAITGEESIYTDILRGYGENSRIFMNKDSVTMKEYVIRLDQVKSMAEINLRNGKPLFQLDIIAAGIVDQGVDQNAKTKITEKLNLYKEIEGLVNTYLKDKLTNQLNEIIKKQRLDYLNILRMSRYKNREIYGFYKDKQDRFVEDLEIEVNVKISIQ